MHGITQAAPEHYLCWSPTRTKPSTERLVRGGWPLALRITCPHCGSGPYSDFWFGGEDRPIPAIGSEGLEENFDRVWLRENVSGVQTELWYHYAGCRRWFRLERNTQTNEIHGELRF